MDEAGLVELSSALLDDLGWTSDTLLEVVVIEDAILLRALAAQDNVA